MCVADQPTLDGKYTVFGRVSEGILVVQKISEAEVDEAGRVRDRIEIRRVTIRDKPAPEADPFSTETVQQLSAIRATLETSMGILASRSSRTRRRNMFATFSVWRALASTMGRACIGSPAGS